MLLVPWHWYFCLTCWYRFSRAHNALPHRDTQVVNIVYLCKFYSSKYIQTLSFSPWNMCISRPTRHISYGEIRVAFHIVLFPKNERILITRLVKTSEVWMYVAKRWRYACLSCSQPNLHAAKFHGSRAIIYKFKANLMFPRGKRDHEIYDMHFTRTSSFCVSSHWFQKDHPTQIHSGKCLNSLLFLKSAVIRILLKE